MDNFATIVNGEKPLDVCGVLGHVSGLFPKVYAKLPKLTGENPRSN